MIPQQIMLASKEPPLRVIGWRGEEAPTLTEGFGGWTTIARPRRYSITDFTGLEPLKMSLPMLLDGWASNDSQEPFIRNIERMARIDAGRKSPSIVEVTGAVPYPGVSWVIESLSWGESLWSDGGFRVRQQVTLSLMQYVEDKHLAKLAKRNQRSKSNKVYVVKAGEHLGEIAARQLGDAQRWREIAELNNMRDPKSVKKGQRIRMPAK